MDVEVAGAGEEEEVAIGGGEGLVVLVHAAGKAVGVDGETVFGGGVAISADEFKAVGEGVKAGFGLFGRHCEREWRPADLVGREGQALHRVERLDRRFDGTRLGAAGEDAVEPCLEVFKTGSCKGRSAELFGIEAMGRLKRRVLSNGEGIWKSFGPADTCICQYGL